MRERRDGWRMEKGKKKRKSGEKSEKMRKSDCCQMWRSRVRELVHVHLYIYAHTLKNACKQLCVHWFINLHYITIFLIPALVFTASVSSFIFTEYLVKSCIFTYTYRKKQTSGQSKRQLTNIWTGRDFKNKTSEIYICSIPHLQEQCWCSVSTSWMFCPRL